MKEKSNIRPLLTHHSILAVCKVLHLIISQAMDLLNVVFHLVPAREWLLANGLTTVALGNWTPEYRLVDGVSPVEVSIEVEPAAVVLLSSALLMVTLEDESATIVRDLNSTDSGDLVTGEAGRS